MVSASPPPRYHTVPWTAALLGPLASVPVGALPAEVHGQASLEGTAGPELTHHSAPRFHVRPWSGAPCGSQHRDGTVATPRSWVNRGPRGHLQVPGGLPSPAPCSGWSAHSVLCLCGSLHGLLVKGTIPPTCRLCPHFWGGDTHETLTSVFLRLAAGSGGFVGRQLRPTEAHPPPAQWPGTSRPL